MIGALHVVLVTMVLSGATVLVVGVLQYLLAGIHFLRRPYARARELYPCVAVIIPAWNEGAVVGRTIDHLMNMRYPRDRIRVYVVDDGSTDQTPSVIQERSVAYPGSVLHLRRPNGGAGKADALNHGLIRVEQDDWYEAVLIIDADVLLTPTALRRMARHFGDTMVGGVTAYIKEASIPPNYLNRFVRYEYITAQAAARRAQNTLGAQACLAGGAQLIRREALECLGGQLDASTLAEDTVTTFRIQLAGYDVRFDGNAVVLAEEPNTLAALWRQRVRWARGNTQVTALFRGVWLHRLRVGALGGPTFAAIWTSVTMMPVFMLASTIGLVTLFIIDRELSIQALQSLWALSGATFLFITLSSLLMDTQEARRCWREGLLFPGLINLILIVFGLFGPFITDAFGNQLAAIGLRHGQPAVTYLLLFADVWLSLSILCAYLVKRLEQTRHLSWLAPPLLYLVGYGPFLCAITVGGYIAELRGAERRWDKTDKVGRVGEMVA
jgi:cellulose synthase/poly-beta-1,6-N-acetylglucosamine synthase-like glycosyltransferase